MKISAPKIRLARTARSTLLRSVAGAALIGLPSAALAQDAAGDAGQPDSEAFASDEIIVLARKQAETLQEVPVTITSVSSETLEKYNVDQVADVVSRVPTLNVQVGGSGSGGQISLRGVGSSNISAAFDSAVAFDFDGVQVSTMRLVQAGFFDTAQIDVLKGPQSLFFGKSASAGVFSIRSADPTPTWEFGGKGSYEFEEQGYTVQGFVSGPISETVGIRLAAQYNKIDHFAELQEGTPAANGRYRGVKNFVARGTLAWDPDDRFSANLKVQYVKNENDGGIQHSDLLCNDGVADPVTLFSGLFQIPAGYDCNAFDQKYFLPDTHPALAPGVPEPSEAAGRNGVPFGKTDLWFGRLRFDFDMSDELTLTSVTGIVNLDAVDFDNYSYGGIGDGIFAPGGSFLPVGAPGGVGTSDPTNKLEQYTQEIRLASDFDSMFNFMMGVFYEDRTFTFATAQNGVNATLLAGPDPVTGYTYDWDKVHLTKTEALSLFGSVTLDITDQLELSGGIRWTDESKVQRITIPYMHTFLETVLGFAPSGFFSGPIEFSDSNWSPEVTVKYQVTPDVNVFASYKTGFKSGGIDNSALPSNSLRGFGSSDPAVREAAAAGLIFESETAEGGEIGVKSQFANGDVTLNVTGYYYKFDDLQVQNFDGVNIQFITQNAGKVTTKGVDIGWGWQTPVDGLALSGNIAWLDGKFTDTFLVGGGAIDLDGRDVARAPEWSGNIAFDFTAPLGDSLELGLSGNAAYSDSYFASNGPVQYVQDSYVTLDASVSVQHPDGNWKLALVGTNLTDEIWANTAGERPFQAVAGLEANDTILTQNRGRQVFVEASFRF